LISKGNESYHAAYMLNVYFSSLWNGYSSSVRPDKLERLADLRKKIDEVDEQMLTLLRKRVTIAEQIGKVKTEKVLPIRDEQREREVLDRVASKAEVKGINPENARRIFREIIELSVEAQKRT